MGTTTRGTLLLGQPAKGLREIAYQLANRTLGLNCLEALYDALPPTTDALEFLSAARVSLDLRCDLRTQGNDEAIPATGPLIVVCNHPFGGADSLLLTEYLLALRPDLRVLGNQVLMRIPELAPVLLPVDILGTANLRILSNLRSVRNALRWLQTGGALLVFPAGEVASLRATGGVTDQRWNPLAGWLIRHSGACVIPACFEGRNPWWFHLAGLLNPGLRTALLPRVLLSHRHRDFTLHVGTRISSSRLDRLGCDQLVSDFLRAIALNLPHKQRLSITAAPVEPLAPSPHPPVAPARAVVRASHEALIEAVAPELLAAEIGALDATALLLSDRHLHVYVAPAVNLPCVLRELGRLRELTFRQAGEGTGKACDLDRFDEDYLHLFSWDSEARCIVGAYRLGLVDEILRRRGRRGLYTHSLFRYSDRLLQQLGPAVELGRAFVAVEHQKHFSSLLLLWRGISTFVSRHPQYCTLFGPVSISADYAPASRRCLVRYLRRHAYDPELARQVRARHPYRTWARYDASDAVWKKVHSIGDVDAFSRLLSLAEKNSLGVPLLLRQYLKLGGRVIGFSIDDDFQSSLDTLMVVDLRVAPVELLARYMGAAEATAFLAWHQGSAHSTQRSA